MSVANLKNKFSNQSDAPLKAPGTSFLHGNKFGGLANTTPVVQQNGNGETKPNANRWGTLRRGSLNGSDTENKAQNGVPSLSNGPSHHDALEKRQSSENFGVTLKKVVSPCETEQSNNRSFLHNTNANNNSGINFKSAPPSPKSPGNQANNGSISLKSASVSPSATLKTTVFKVADNSKFAKVQQEKLQTSSPFSLPSSAPSMTTVSSSLPEGKKSPERGYTETNSFSSGITPNKSNLFNSIVKPSTNGPSVSNSSYSRTNLNKVNSFDEPDSVKTKSPPEPSRKFGQVRETSPTTTNGTPAKFGGQQNLNTNTTSVNGSGKFVATKTIGNALGKLLPKPNELNISSSSSVHTSIPVPKKGSTDIPHLSPMASSPTGLNPERLRLKCEESERKRKTLIGENQKVQRDLAELEKKFELLKKEHDNTKSELHKKDYQLNHLRNLSEGVYKEYDQLKHQHDWRLARCVKQWTEHHAGIKRIKN
ncbi:hypothetical protein WDU94_002374 [Cyamophila willieti]